MTKNDLSLNCLMYIEPTLLYSIFFGVVVASVVRYLTRDIVLHGNEGEETENEGEGEETENGSIRTKSIEGWVKFVRKQGNKMFIELYDGYVMTQVMVSGKGTKQLGKEIFPQTTLKVEGSYHLDDRSKSGDEIRCGPEGVTIIGKSDPDFESAFNTESGRHVLHDKRHLVLRGERGEDEYRLIEMFRKRDQLEDRISNFFTYSSATKVSPPTLVQGQVEGGATLFEVHFHGGQKAYLTQSSQLYLETCLPLFRNVYCLEYSYRAEKSKTPRHLLEFKHLEAEFAFIDFEKLLCNIENMVRFVSNDYWQTSQDRFRCMTYHSVIELLNEKLGKSLKIGDDLTDATERELMEYIGEPLFVTHFPSQMKAFYMKRVHLDGIEEELTESVDLLLPGVGEVVGGSMRIEDHDELLEAMKKSGITDPENYEYYTDQRKYGSCPHGGYGMGLERLMVSMKDVFHAPTVQECCLYPRYTGRCKP